MAQVPSIEDAWLLIDNGMVHSFGQMATLPEVREACVVGVPDERWGQAVVAAVVPADPSTLPREDALRAVVRARAGRAAAPKRFLFVAELPLRGPGKIDRVAVRELFTRPFADR